MRHPSSHINRMGMGHRAVSLLGTSLSYRLQRIRTPGDTLVHRHRNGFWDTRGFSLSLVFVSNL